MGVPLRFSCFVQTCLVLLFPIEDPLSFTYFYRRCPEDFTYLWKSLQCRTFFNHRFPLEDLMKFSILHGSPSEFLRFYTDFSSTYISNRGPLKFRLFLSEVSRGFYFFVGESPIEDLLQYPFPLEDLIKFSILPGRKSEELDFLQTCPVPQCNIT